MFHRTPGILGDRDGVLYHCFVDLVWGILVEGITHLRIHEVAGGGGGGGNGGDINPCHAGINTEPCTVVTTPVWNCYATITKEGVELTYKTQPPAAPVHITSTGEIVMWVVAAVALMLIFGKLISDVLGGKDGKPHVRDGDL